MERQLIHELILLITYSLNPPTELLAILNSYGDTLDDEEMLSMLRDYNDKGSAFRDIITSR